MLVKEDLEKMTDPQPCRIKNEDTEEQIDMMEVKKESQAEVDEKHQNVKTKHNVSQKGTLRTEDINCEKSFREDECPADHMRTQNGEKPFTCHLCGNSLSNAKQLNRHMRIHTGEKPFACHQCGKFFRCQSNLNTHMKIHTGVKPFTCHLCGKSFTRKCGLERHMIIHTGEKPFTCHLCGKSLTRLTSLESHVRIHNGEKPFACHQCEKCFTTAGELKQHLIIHTGEKPFTCQQCPKSFKWHISLKNHQRLHSGDILASLWHKDTHDTSNVKVFHSTPESSKENKRWRESTLEENLIIEKTQVTQ